MASFKCCRETGYSLTHSVAYVVKYDSQYATDRIQEIGSRLVVQRLRLKLCNRPTTTHAEYRIVQCLLSADALFLEVTKAVSLSNPLAYRFTKPLVNCTNNKIVCLP